jgi:serine/threonine protein kinase
VFEPMEGHLYQLIRSRHGRRPFANGLVASIFQQIVQGLHHIHASGYFHWDMKPENILVTTTGHQSYPNLSPIAPDAPPEQDVKVLVKLADFGLARETRSRPPYTKYISAQWYRALEVCHAYLDGHAMVCNIHWPHRGHPRAYTIPVFEVWSTFSHVWS